MGIFYDQLYGKKCCYKHLNIIKYFFFPDFYLFRYFWHKSLIKVLMPKIPQKVKILEKKIIFPEFKNTIFYKHWLLTVDVDATALFLVDVNQTTLFQPVDGRRSSMSVKMSTSVDVHFTALFITPKFNLVSLKTQFLMF